MGFACSLELKIYVPYDLLLDYTKIIQYVTYVPYSIYGLADEWNKLIFGEITKF